MRSHALIAALFLAAPAFAHSPAPVSTPPATPAATPSTDPLDKMVCRSQETIGSRLKSHKVCATVREWKEQEQDSRETVELYQQRNQSTIPSTDPPDTPMPQ